LVGAAKFGLEQGAMAFGAIAGMALGDPSSALSTGMAAKGAMQFGTGVAEDHLNRKTIEENREVLESSLDRFAERYQEENGTASYQEIARAALALRNLSNTEGLQDYQYDLLQEADDFDEGIEKLESCLSKKTSNRYAIALEGADTLTLDKFTGDNDNVFELGELERLMEVILSVIGTPRNQGMHGITDSDAYSGWD